MCKFSSNLGQNRYIMCSPFCNTLLLSVCAVLFSFVCMCSSTELAVASTKLKHQFAFYPLYYAQVQYRPGDDDGFFPHLPERWGEGSTIHSPPALGDQLAHTNSTFFSARISPKCLSKLRRLWTNVPRRVVCGLISLISSNTMPGQHSQPYPTSSGQGCMRAHV